MPRLRDLVAILLVGDGVLAVMAPQRRMRRWLIGPSWFRELVGWFERRPNLSRALGLLTALVGVAIALPRQR
jgi:hypothetical protein